jgi:hypothetical protein
MGLGGSPGPSTSSAGEKGLDDAGRFLAPRRARVGADGDQAAGLTGTASQKGQDWGCEGGPRTSHGGGGHGTNWVGRARGRRRDQRHCYEHPAVRYRPPGLRWFTRRMLDFSSSPSGEFGWISAMNRRTRRYVIATTQRRAASKRAPSFDARTSN